MARPGQAAALFVGSGFLLGMSILIRPQDVALLAPPILIGVVLGFRAIASAWRIAAPSHAGRIGHPNLDSVVLNYRIFDSAWALGYGRTDVQPLLCVYMPSFDFPIHSRFKPPSSNFYGSSCDSTRAS